MTPRRPNTRIAAVEIAFVFLSAIAGGMGEPWTWAAGFAAANMAHWGWSRRGALGQIAKDRLPGQIGMALGLIAAVHAGVYLAGRVLNGVG
jgi:hypothetical protein